MAAVVKKNIIRNLSFFSFVIFTLSLFPRPIFAEAKIPAKNWISSLPKSDFIRLLGDRSDPTLEQLEVDRKFEMVMSQNLPPKMDWRNRDGVDFIGPVKNQGYCGSCLVFATLGTFEAQEAINAKSPNYLRRYSEDALIACTTPCDGGTLGFIVRGRLKKIGVPDAACMPYEMGYTGKDKKCTDVCANADGRMHKAKEYIQVNGLLEMKTALQTGPLMISIFVYEDFQNYAGGVYRQKFGTRLGKHSVSVIGYDDELKAWIVRNSWGRDWGDNGFMYLSYDDRQTFPTEIAIQIVPEKPAETAFSIQDWQTIAGATTLTARTDQPDASERQVKLSISSSLQTQEDSSFSDLGQCVLNQCAIPFDTTSLKNGRYILKMDVTKNSQVIETTYRDVFVANSDLDVQFTIKKDTSSDPEYNRRSQLFRIQIDSKNGVQLEMIRVRFFDSDHKMVVERNYDRLVPNLVFGIRKNLISNATQVQIIGEISQRGKKVQIQSEFFDL